MSDEQRKDAETEVEAHTNKYGVNDGPSDDSEVEAHTNKYGANDEPSDENEVEGHVHRAT